jgi:hypothetical protein
MSATEITTATQRITPPGEASDVDPRTKAETTIGGRLHRKLIVEFLGIVQASLRTGSRTPSASRFIRARWRGALERAGRPRSR